MALNEKERQRIIEEETLRAETRQNLMQGMCSRHRCGRCYFGYWLIVALLIAGVVCSYGRHERYESRGYLESEERMQQNDWERRNPVETPVKTPTK